MKLLARLFIRCAAMLASRSHRDRWREEWLGELDAIYPERHTAIWRFVLGAPADAVSTRSPMHLMTAAGGDAKYAVRQLLRRPAHTLAVIACLVIGLVASVATFSVISSLMYGDLPGVSERSTLSSVQLSYNSAADGPERVNWPMSFNDFAVFRSGPLGSSVEAIAAEGSFRLTAIGDHGPASVRTAFASGDFFKVLRTAPALGRFFTSNDDRAESPRVAVVSEYFWRTNLDGRADAIGGAILAGGVSYAVVGVAPAHFHGLQLELGEPDSVGVQVWIPLAHLPASPVRPALDDRFIGMIARRHAGATPADLERQLSIGAALVAASNPANRAVAAVHAKTIGMGPNDTSIEVLALMAAAMSVPLIVLAIGCANVANLQLARVAEQSRELAIRLSLGATRAQLLRLLTAETLARVVAAVLLSLALISAVLRWIGPLSPIPITLDWRVLLFASTLATGVAMATGTVPAWLVLRRSAAGQLKQSAQSGGVGHSRLRGTLVMIQVALSLGLLVMTGLFAQTMDAVAGAAPAALRQQLVATFDTSELKISPAEASRFAELVATRAAGDSRVKRVSLSASQDARYGLASGPRDHDRSVELIGATSSLSDVMDLRVLAGRRLTDADDRASAMLSARAAEDISPGASPIGQMLRISVRGGEHVASTERLVRIVGVVADNQLRPTSWRPDAVVYVPFPNELTGTFTMRVRAEQPDALEPELMALITQLDPRAAWSSIGRGDRPFEQDSKEMGYLASSVGVSGIIALVLSATGLYAVMSYVVTLRRREIGVRLAIGAPPSQIVALMLRQSMRLVAAGVGFGLLLAVPLAFWMRSVVIIEADPADPMAFLPTMLLLVVVGALAAAVPSLRASRVDPISTLRQD